MRDHEQIAASSLTFCFESYRVALVEGSSYRNINLPREYYTKPHTSGKTFGYRKPPDPADPYAEKHLVR